MADLTKHDAIIEANEEMKPIRKKQEERVKRVFKNSGTIVTISIVVLSMTLFSYNMGFCSIYSLPPSALSIDITKFIPFAVQMIGILIYIFMYISSFLADRVTKNSGFEITRVIIGVTICSWFILHNKLIYALGFWGLIISFGIPIFLELIILFIDKRKNKPIKNPKIDSEQYKYEKREYISRTIFPHYSVKMFVCVIAMVVCLSLVFGMISACTKREYQVIKNQNVIYAIVADNSDTLIAQKAKVNDETIEINTNSFFYFPKSEHELFRVVFKNVVFSKHDNVKILEEIQATKDQVQ